MAMAVLTILGPYFPIQYCLSDGYLSTSLLYRFSYLQVASVVARMKYYFIWKLSEATGVLTGIAFNGYDVNGQPRWDRTMNVQIGAYEWAENPRSLLASWNISTNRWLRYYVYERLSTGGSAATLATFVVSAVWHGFYAGYYLTFISGSIITSLARSK